MRIKNKKKETITASAMLIFSMVYLYASLGLQLGTVRNPGAGFLPLLVGLGLLVSSCLYLYQVVRQPRAVFDEEKSVKERHLRVPAGIAAVVFVYPLLLQQLYFILTTALCLLVLFRLLRFKGWTFSLLAALSISVLIFLFFFRAGVILPNGAVEQLFYNLWS